MPAKFCNSAHAKVSQSFVLMLVMIYQLHTFAGKIDGSDVVNKNFIIVLMLEYHCPLCCSFMYFLQ